jgi:hypothetical protein
MIPPGALVMLTSLIAGTFFGVENLAGLVHLFPVCGYAAILDPPVRVPFCHNPPILKNEKYIYIYIYIYFLSLVDQYVFIFNHSCATVPTSITSQNFQDSKFFPNNLFQLLSKTSFCAQV